MCGRFNIIDDPLVHLLSELTGVRFPLPTRFNIAPTEPVPVLRRADSGDWDMREMRWWLVPCWSSGPTTKYAMFNARAESLTKSRAFREPFRKRRCLIPASGYYEWKTEKGIRVPYYIEPGNREGGFLFAGLWDCWKPADETGRDMYSCTMVTAAAPACMRGVHHRIPVHLTREEAMHWLDPTQPTRALHELLAPEIRFPLTVTPVSSYVNHAGNKDGRCIERMGETIYLRPGELPAGSSPVQPM